MTDLDIKKFRVALDNIKSELSSLKKHIAFVNDCIDAAQLISETNVRSLSEALNRYTSQYAALQEAGDRLSISLSTDITAIEAALKVHEEQLESAQLREIILDYFRLKAEGARYLHCRMYTWYYRCRVLLQRYTKWNYVMFRRNLQCHCFISARKKRTQRLRPAPAAVNALQVKSPAIAALRQKTAFAA